MIYELQGGTHNDIKESDNNNIKIESVNDLYKLKPFWEDGTLKINNDAG